MFKCVQIFWGDQAFYFLVRNIANVFPGFAMAVLLSLIMLNQGCGSEDSSDVAISVSYSLARQYTGLETNTLMITAGEGSDEKFEFSIGNTDANLSVTAGTFLALETQDITLSYSDVGVYSADLKIQKTNGQPIVFEVLNWEFSEEVPELPVVSFADKATNKQTNNLLVSDSRSDSVSQIWVAGGVTIPTGSETEDDGYWQTISSDLSYVPVTLSDGDGVKSIDAKFRNLFGNESGKGVPAQIILKQNPPTNCSAVPLSATISDNKLSLLMNAKDGYETYYTVSGSVKQVIDQKVFTDGELVFVYLEPSPGAKTVNVFIEDIAGNFCLDKLINVTIDPNFVAEGISVDGSSYWTETENIVVDVLFSHFPDQEPLQIKITGNVSGSNTGKWIPYAPDVSISLSPTTKGQRTILAQYKDVDGTESYLISKKIFLKPDVVAGGGTVAIDNIAGLESVTIVGCVEAYSSVAYAASYTCTANAPTVDVTYNFPDGITLTKSDTP